MSYDYDYIDDQDFVDNLGSPDTLDMYDQLSVLEGTTTDYSDPFWQTQAGIDAQDLFNFGDPLGNLDQTNYSGDISVGGSSGSSGSSGSGGLGGLVNGVLRGLGGSDNALWNIGSTLLGGYNLYNDIDTNKDLKELLSNSIYNTRNDQYRAYTGQAGEHTRDAYTVGLNQQKMDLMMALMAADENLPSADRAKLTGGLSALTDRYSPAFEGYANDMIYDRNAKYQADYNSQAPFQTGATPQMSQTQPAPQTDFMSTIPQDADPALIAAYQQYLAGA